jgi:hypothetical protein
VRSAPPTTRPFAEALDELLRESDYTTLDGRPKLSALLADLHGVGRTELYAAARGERTPSVELMEECARVLAVRPEVFREYRSAKVGRLEVAGGAAAAPAEAA